MSPALAYMVAVKAVRSRPLAAFFALQVDVPDDFVELIYWHLRVL
jgi:hypothetical protein